MSSGQNPVIKYSISFKRKVVEEIEKEGLGIGEASRRYGIKGGSTVSKWVRKFGEYHLQTRIIRIETMEERDRIKQLEEENKKLKLALADAALANRCLEVVVEEANKIYKTDLKKKFADPAFSDSARTNRL